MAISFSSAPMIRSDRWPAAALQLAVLAVYGVLLRWTPAFLSPLGTAELLAPAAGVALAAAACWGWRALPALVLVAGLVAGLKNGLALSGGAMLQLLWPALVQAAVGAWLMPPNEQRGALRLEAAGEILQRLLLPAALAALLGAMPAALGAGATVQSAGFAMLAHAGASFGGMLLVAPIVLALVAPAREHWVHRRLTVGLPLFAVIGLLGAALFSIERWDLEHARATFEQHARSAFARIESQLLATEQGVAAVHGAMLATQGQITRAQFDALAHPWLTQSVGLLSLGWHVRVPRSDFAQYQAEVAATGETDFQLRNRPGGVPEDVLAQDSDVVVMRHGAIARPEAGRRAVALGINVLSIPEARATVLKALRGGPVRATPAFKLTGLASHGLGLTLYRPVRQADGSTAGLVFAAVFLDQTLGSAQQGLTVPLALCVVDLEPDASLRRLAGAPGCDSQAAGPRLLRRQEAIEFANRRWLLQADMPLSQAAGIAGLRNVWLFAAPGLAGAGLLSVLLLLTTGRAQRESRERRQAEEGAAGIFETASVGLLQLGPQGAIRHANPAYCAMTGYSLEELRRMRVHDFIVDRDLTLGVEIERAVQGPPDILVQHRHSYRRKDGSELPVSASLRVIRDEAGRPLYTVAAVQDISDTVRLHEAERERDRAEAANLAKSEFVARMSHELRTPLNAILGFTQLLDGLQPEGPATAKQRAWLAHIQQAGWHLLAMINDLLDLSRLESGTLSLEPQALELRAIIESCLAMVTPAAARRGISVSSHLAEDALAAHGDPVRVRQVLINLLSNAVKYNRDGGQLTVRSRRLSATQIEIEVADTGEGMTAEQMTALFQPFNRLGRERSGVEGTGIGLVIAKRLAELMGGTLRVHGVAGQGTAFTLVLPTAAQAPAPAPTPLAASGEAQPRRAGHRVLYIEDNETNVEVIRAMLAQRGGLQLEIACNGRDGLEQALARPPDLLLLDLGLPDLDGLEVLRRLRADARTAALPVIVVSADAMTQSVVNALQAGANDYVTKPVSLVALLSAVDTQLGAAAGGPTLKVVSGGLASRA